jgi:hypothetical protein
MTTTARWVAFLRALLAVIALLALGRTASAQKRAAPLAAAAPGASRYAWTNPKARELAREGVDAKKAGDMQLCVQKDQASLALEEHPFVRLHVSSCLGATGKVVDALKAAQIALSAAVKNGDEDLRPIAEARVRELLPRIAHVTFKLPPLAGGQDEALKVRFDGIPVRKALFRQSIPVDPGEHVAEATRSDKGDVLTFREELTLADGEDRTIEVVLKPNFLPEETRKCLERASSYEERVACIEQQKTTPNVRLGIEMSGYTDSTATHVFSPSLNASVVSPTGGWNVSGSYLLDVLTAASPDIVSMASGRYDETRHAGSLTGGYKIDAVQLQASGNVSREPDYLSITGGLAGSIETMDKHVTPRLAYALTADTIGIRSTPFSQYHRNLTSHEIEAGGTFVLSPSTLLVTGITARFELGEQSKLYRYVPVFDAKTIPNIEAGAAAEKVNALRLSARPREMLPGSRSRLALGGRLNHRAGGSTIRVEERLYMDTWGIFGTTTDARWLHDATDRLRVWPHARLHFQTEAKFYQLAYEGIEGPNGIETFRYRTGDRELSRMVSLTLGGGARYELSPAKATTKYAVLASGEVMLSHYFMSLYITGRTALYGTLGFEVEL